MEKTIIALVACVMFGLLAYLSMDLRDRERKTFFYIVLVITLVFCVYFGSKYSD